MSTGLLEYMVRKKRIFFVRDEGKKARASLNVIFYINTRSSVFDIQSF